jgi:hypothetical protein
MNDGRPETARAAPAQARRLNRLRHIRHELSQWSPCFFEKHRDFWPIARAASNFASCEDWPDVETYTSAFDIDDGEPPVRFEQAPAKRRRPAGPVVRSSLYDAVIVQRRIVLTRPRMWHDYLNALVWTAFPRAKLALHRRQHAAIERWIPEGATQLPNARTRELDALALVDEGGVLILSQRERPVSATAIATELSLEQGETSMHFGHALFEGLVLGQPAMIARAVVLDARGYEWRSEREAVRLADTLLAKTLDDTACVVSPDELPRLPL